MASKRSGADKTQDGIKAHECKIAKFGPDEPNRAARQMAWTKRHGRDVENPHVRGRVYSPVDQERFGYFDVWHKFNPASSHADNPHSWQNAQLHRAS